MHTSSPSTANLISRSSAQSMRPHQSVAGLWTRSQVVLVAVTILTAVAYAFTLRSNFTFVDESIYFHIALNIRHLHAFTLDGLSPTAIRPPSFPWTLVLVQSLSESVRFAKTVDLLLWPLCAVLMASITRRLFGQLASTISLVLGLLYVVELYTAGTLYPQALAATLLLTSLWLEFVWRRGRSSAAAVLQGAVWAWLVLAVPVFLINLLVYLGWLAFARGRLRSVAVIAGLVVAVLVGWSARNQNQLHGFFLSDNSGEMLLYGNSDLTGPNTGPRVPIWLLAPSAFAQKDEVRLENGYKRAAVEWIHAHPRRAAVLYLEKTANWLNCRTNLMTSTRHATLSAAFLALVFYPILLLALCSPVVAPEKRGFILLFALHYLLAAAAYAVFFTRIRYRLPYDYLLMMLAAATLAKIWEHLQLRAFTPQSRWVDVPVVLP